MVNPPRKLLLLGGTGYIGSRLYRYLASRGVAVDTVDLELRGNRINLDNIRMDYRDLTAQFLSAYDVVVLLAGHSTVAQSLRDPYGAFENNLVKFAHLLGKLAVGIRSDLVLFWSDGAQPDALKLCLLLAP